MRNTYNDKLLYNNSSPIYPIDNNINLTELIETMNNTIKYNYIPQVSIDLITRIIQQSDTKLRNNLLHYLSERFELIAPKDFTKGDNIYYKYYKYLRGMLIYMEMMTCVSRFDTVKTKERCTHNTKSSHVKEILSKEYNFNKGMLTNITTINPRPSIVKFQAGKIDISSPNYEDLIFFLYSHFISKEFSCNTDIFCIKSTINKDFKYNYTNLKKALEDYFKIFKIFEDGHESKIAGTAALRSVRNTLKTTTTDISLIHQIKRNKGEKFLL